MNSIEENRYRETLKECDTVELFGILSHIDKDKYPDKLEMVTNEIEKRKKEIGPIEFKKQTIELFKVDEIKINESVQKMRIVSIVFGILALVYLGISALDNVYIEFLGALFLISVFIYVVFLLYRDKNGDVKNKT